MNSVKHRVAAPKESRHAGLGRARLQRAAGRVVEALERRVLLSTVSWISPTSGDWSVATNWDAGRVPGVSDDVVINVPQNVKVTVSNNQAAGTLHVASNDTLEVAAGQLTLATTVTTSSSVAGPLLLDGGILSTGQTVAVSGATTWSAGGISGVGTFSNTGTLTVTGTGTHDLFGGILFNNSSSVVDQATGDIRFFDGSLFDNLGSGVFDFQADTVLEFNSGGGGQFSNFGTVRKSVGVGNSQFNVPFNNLGGTVDVKTGVITVAGHGTEQGGTFNAAIGATLDLTGGSTTSFSGTFTGSGGGTVLLQSGTAVISGVTTLNFPTGLFQWTGGAISGGSVTNTGSLTLSGAGTRDLVAGTELTNGGTITDTAAGNLRFFDNSTVTNQALGTFDFKTDAGLEFNSGGGGQFDNLGTVVKSAGTGNTSLAVPLNNTAGGTLKVQTGTLTIARGGNVQGGNFVVSANAILDLTGGSTTLLSGTFTGSGAGTVLLQSGVASVSGVTFNFPVGLFVWTGGAISGGTLTNTNVITLAGSNPHDLTSAAIIVNSGTVTDQATGNLRFFDASKVNNPLGGIFDFQSTGGLEFNSGGGGSFNNVGTVRKSVSSGTVIDAVPFNNQGGTLDIRTGTFLLAGNGTMTDGTFNVSSGAVLDLTGGTSGNVYGGSYSGSGGGQVLLQNGTLNIPTAGATFNFQPGYFQWAGGTIATGPLNNSGYITLAGTATKDFAGVQVSNTGTITYAGSGDLRFFNGTTLTNQSTGTIDFQSTTGGLEFNSGGGGQLNNSGTLLGSSTNTNVTIGVPLNNAAAGIINLQHGNITIARGGTSLGGTFNVGVNATLDLTGGGTTLLGGAYVGSGGGTVLLQNGAVQVPATGATFNFTGSTFQWTGGSIVGGPLLNTGTINLSGPATHDLAQAAVLDNAGVINDAASGNLRFFDLSTLNNHAGGLFDFQSTGGMQFNSGGGGQLNNSGTIRGSSTNTAASIGVPFNNAAVGIIDLQAGAITIAGGGTSLGGTFNVGAGATLNLTGGGTTVLGGAYGGTIGGTVLLANGTLQIPTGGATFNFGGGTFQWTGGSIVGAPLLNNGTITIAGPATHDLAVGEVLNNAGVINQTGTGNLRFFDVSTLNNRVGALYDFQNDGGLEFNSGGGGTFNNLGTLRKSGGAVNSQDGVPLNNQGGVIDVRTGQITLAGNGASTGGTFTVSSGATLDLTGATGGNSYGGSYSGSGGGRVLLQNGVLNVAGNATFNFPAGYFQWAGGTLAGGPLLNTGFITIAGASTHDLAGDTINNAGTFTDTGTGNLRFFNGSTFNNQTGALFDFQNDTGLEFNSGGGGVFNNMGTLRKSAGNGNTQDGVPLNNLGGTIDAGTGSVTLAGGGTSTGGTLNAGHLALLDLTGGTSSNVFGGTYVSGPGNGQILLQNGTLRVAPGGVNFSLSATSPFLWEGGAITGGPFTNTGVLETLGAASYDLVGGVTFNNAGTVNDFAFGNLRFFDGSTLNNLANGTFNIEGPGGFEFNSGGGGTASNFGLLTKSLGTNTTLINVLTSNSGTIAASSGGLLFNNGVEEVSGNTLTRGTWTASNGASIQITGANILDNEGNIVLSGAGSTFAPIANLNTNGGHLTVTNGASFNAPAGLFNSGTVTIGAATTLNVTGAYQQAAAGTLAVELGGTPASGNFGKLASTGAATLGGTLQATLVNGFVPSAAQQFVVETYANHSNAFSTTSLPSSPGLMFTAAVNGTNVTLNGMATVPTSSVNSLPATQSSRSFNVSWAGQDYSGGPGIKFFDVYVSDNGGAFTRFLSQTTVTSTTFTGAYGHTYGFYTVATDLLNNVEPTPTLAEATTTVAVPTIAVVPTPIAPITGTAFSGQVATFTDSDVSVTSGFTATITWGDGHVTTGTITAGAPGSFTVSGSNTYATSGSKTLMVTISDGLGNSRSGSEPVVVTPTITVIPTPISPTAGTPFSGQVAVFTDSDLTVTSGFTATITWGDGHVTTGTVTPATLGTFTVSGSNTYATSGLKTLMVSVSDGLGNSMSGSEAVTVLPGIPVGTITLASAASLSATAGVAIGTDQPLATFNTTFPLSPLSNFSATINWGDGTTTAGQVAVSGSQITVSGSHAFATAGTAHPVVTLLNAGVTATASPMVNVLSQAGSAPAGQAKIVYFLANKVGNILTDTATITNTGTTPIAGPVAVLVQFGLPKPAGVVLTNANGTTNLAGNVTLGPTSTTLFAQNSPYVIVAPGGIAPGQTVNFSLVFNVTGSTFFGFTLGALSGANLSSGAGNLYTVNTGAGGIGQQQFSATVGQPLNNVTLALFKDFGPTLPTGSYAASIDWMDGTPKTSGVVTSANGLLSVAGSHTYQTAGRFTPSVTLVDPNSAAVSARSIVTVTAPVLTQRVVVPLAVKAKTSPAHSAAPVSGHHHHARGAKASRGHRRGKK